MAKTPGYRPRVFQAWSVLCSRQWSRMCRCCWMFAWWVLTQTIHSGSSFWSLLYCDSTPIADICTIYCPTTVMTLIIHQNCVCHSFTFYTIIEYFSVSALLFYNCCCFLLMQQFYYDMLLKETLLFSSSQSLCQWLLLHLRC